MLQTTRQPGPPSSSNGLLSWIYAAPNRGDLGTYSISTMKNNSWPLIVFPGVQKPISDPKKCGNAQNHYSIVYRLVSGQSR